MTKTALVLRHVHFEDLGSFASPIRQAGYDIRYADVGDSSFPPGDPLAPDLLVVLGGPIGVYEEKIYPFLAPERAFVAARLEARRPLLGVCLGAQLIAAASGARVFPSGVKEIGFKAVSLTAAGRESPLRHLEGASPLHWHGDTYSLPAGATNLASSDLIEQQAFSFGREVLGLQFHPEADCGDRFERWLVGHAAELASARIDVAALRQGARVNGPLLHKASERMIAEWLANLEALT
ncbi:GMP synthase (glutamine-hydrolyzing) [Azospirillum sp. OGB3]|uniref:glutamine amidotransferase n=1 Tax=Azospirillum sp. OGB3 TaxID=2587012 RepID=UPI0016058886|nr:glutamine amidotransferase [Azospirillum sp. OGB3]MBB3268693.1 GMP synthase (glutamine-hydrolyzing) [Azospirillum sp. OGB3]